MEIHLPPEHDSLSRMTINNEQVLLRFTYCDTFDYWTFGVYELNQTPIIAGIKIVPNFPLLLFNQMRRFGGTQFFATSKNQRIGQRDFWDGNAQFWVVKK